MQRRTLTLALVTTLVLGTWSLSAQAVELQQPAPAFTAQDAHGKPISLSDHSGKIVVLEWTNHDCPFVKKHYDSGNIPRLQKDAAAKGVVWLQVISSAPGQQGHVDGATARQVNAYRDATPAGVVLDPQGAIGKQYGARTTPHIFIVDAQGRLAYKGGIDSIPSSRIEDIARAEPHVKNALQALTSGQKVAQASTQPYGCSVKYGS